MSTPYHQLTGAPLNPVKKRIVVSFTRPADTTAYAAGDQVADSTTAPTILTFAAAAKRKGGSGRIILVSLVVNLATVTNGTFRVHFFNKTFTPNNDNAAFAKLDNQAADWIGAVDLPILVADSASAEAAHTRVDEKFGGGDDGVPLPFVCANDDDSLYAVVVATGAYTPSSGEVFSLRIVVEQDN
jgi:hypothetical protein